MEIPVRRWRRIEGGKETGEKEEVGIAIAGNFACIEELDGNGKMRGLVA